MERGFEKISPTSKEYQKDKEEMKGIREEIFGQDEIFGNKVLELSELAKLSEKGHLPSILGTTTTEEYEKKLNEQIVETKEMLRKLIENADIKKIAESFSVINIVHSFFEDIIKNKAFRDELNEKIVWNGSLTGKIRGSIKDGWNFMDTFRKEPGLFTEEIFVRMLQIHKKNFEKIALKFKKNSPEIIKKLEIIITEFFQKFPIGVTEEKIHSIFQDSSFLLKDALFAQMSEFWGSYSVSSGQICLAEQVPENHQIEVLVHELMHALSGRTVNELLIEGQDGQKESAGFEHQRTGVHFGSYEGVENFKPRFEWLNEAITQELTIRSTGVDRLKDKIYVDERKLLGLLLNKGKKPLDIGLFFATYFEDYNPEDPERIQWWKKLNSAINESYEPGFLVKLDKLIKEKGARVAIKYLENPNGR